MNFLDGDQSEKIVTVLSRGRDLLAVIDSHGRATIFHGPNDATYTVEIEKQSAHAGVFVNSGRLLIIGFNEGTISGFRVTTGQNVFDARCGSDAVLFLLGDLSRQRLITGTRSGPMCIFDIAGQLVSKNDGIATDAIALSPDTTMLAAAGLTGEIMLMSAEDLSEIARFDGHRGAVHALHFWLDGDRLVSGGADETVRVWPARKAQRIMSAPIDELRLSYPAPKTN